MGYGSISADASCSSGVETFLYDIGIDIDISGLKSDIYIVVATDRCKHDAIFEDYYDGADGIIVNVGEHNSSALSGCTYTIERSEHSGSYKSITVLAGTSVTFTAKMSPGYTFQGWYATCNSTDTTYLVSIDTSYTVTPSSSITLYAYWTAN